MHPKYSIAVDFDGVIHRASTPFERPDLIPDPPISGAFEWLAEMSKSFAVVVHTARLSGLLIGDFPGTAIDPRPPLEQRLHVKSAIVEWFLREGMDPDVLALLHFWMEPGKPAALVYVDDRGYRFTGANYPSRDEIHRLKPWSRS